MPRQDPPPFPEYQWKALTPKWRHCTVAKHSCVPQQLRVAVTRAALANDGMRRRGLLAAHLLHRYHISPTHSCLPLPCVGSENAQTRKCATIRSKISPPMLLTNHAHLQCKRLNAAPQRAAVVRGACAPAATRWDSLRMGAACGGRQGGGCKGGAGAVGGGGGAGGAGGPVRRHTGMPCSAGAAVPHAFPSPRPLLTRELLARVPLRTQCPRTAPCLPSLTLTPLSTSCSPCAAASQGSRSTSPRRRCGACAFARERSSCPSPSCWSWRRP